MQRKYFIKIMLGSIVALPLIPTKNKKEEELKTIIKSYETSLYKSSTKEQETLTALISSFNKRWDENLEIDSVKDKKTRKFLLADLTRVPKVNSDKFNYKNFQDWMEGYKRDEAPSLNRAIIVTDGHTYDIRV